MSIYTSPTMAVVQRRPSSQLPESNTGGGKGGIDSDRRASRSGALHASIGRKAASPFTRLPFCLKVWQRELIRGRIVILMRPATTARWKVPERHL